MNLLIVVATLPSLKPLPDIWLKSKQPYGYLSKGGTTNISRYYDRISTNTPPCLGNTSELPAGNLMEAGFERATFRAEPQTKRLSV